MVAGEDSRVPCTASRLNQSILKEINPQYTLKEGFKGDSAVKNLLPNVGAAGDLQEFSHSLEEVQLQHQSFQRILRTDLL